MTAICRSETESLVSDIKIFKTTFVTVSCRWNLISKFRANCGKMFIECISQVSRFVYRNTVPYRYSYRYLAKPKSRAPDFITIIQVKKNFRVVYASQNASCHSFSRKKPSPQATRNFALVCLWYGRTVGRAVGYGHVIAKFSRMGSLPHFLTHGAPL